MSSIDSHDRQLLALVQSNSRLSYAELGERVGLSASAVHDRLKKLQTQGVIHGFGARLDPRALGLELCAFIQVLIERPEHTHDARSLERLIAGSIKSLPGVVRTLTMVALSTAKETAAVAVDASAQA
jgi:Lrp/AsnC family leucine-responsive transcriptional regulator